MRQKMISARDITYNSLRTAYTYARNEDIFLVDSKTGNERRITKTAESESNPAFIMNDSKLIYIKNQNVFSWDINTGLTTQLTNFQKSPREDKKDVLTPQETWLKNEQLRNMEVLKTRKEKKDSAEAAAKAFPKEKELRTIYYEDKIVTGLTVSPDGRFITYRLFKPVTNAKSTIIPNYVTESGFTQDIPGRTKVGAPSGTVEFFVFDTEKDTVLNIKPDQVPGIADATDYSKDYIKDTAKKKITNEARKFFWSLLE